VAAGNVVVDDDIVDVVVEDTVRAPVVEDGEMVLLLLLEGSTNVELTA